MCGVCGACGVQNVFNVPDSCPNAPQSDKRMLPSPFFLSFFLSVFAHDLFFRCELTPRACACVELHWVMVVWMDIAVAKAKSYVRGEWTGPVKKQPQSTWALFKQVCVLRCAVLCCAVLCCAVLHATQSLNPLHVDWSDVM